MKIVPLGDKLVVKRQDAEEITTGGIVLPDNARERPRQGRVLSIGEGPMLKDGSRVRPQISEGDRILFATYAGTEIKVDGEDLLILSQDEVLAIVE
ncbi:MAG TPA: co-chaperone GroES [Pirellulaceae bacterium]